MSFRQVLEVRKNDDTDPWSQMIWHPYYVDALAIRFYDSDIIGSQVTYYAAQDANFNVSVSCFASVENGAGS